MRFLFINTLFFLMFTARAQEFVYKTFVKKDRVIFRLKPNSKADLEKYKQIPLKISRTENGTNEKVIVKMLMPYSVVDTVKWPALLRKDKDKFSFVYQVLFANKSSSKDVKQNAKNEKMAFDLLMLSCDFDKEVAIACGLYFCDSTIEQGKIYEYKIAIYTSSVTVKELYTVNINSSQLSTNTDMKDLSISKRFMICELKWRADHLATEYSGYYVERSEDSLNFKTVNKQPLILTYQEGGNQQKSIFYKDTLPLPGKKYYYRVKGLNFFGERSFPSNCVSVFSSAQIHSNPMIDSIKVIGNKDVYLRWRMEKVKENELPINYLLFRSEKEKAGYKLIKESKIADSYIDKNITSTSYYKVLALSAGNDTLYSFSRMAVIYDSIPPEIPTGLKAVCDKNGNLSIRWNRSKEEGLQGFKLYRNNSLNEEPVQINTYFIKDTFYNEKLALNNLSKKVYYALSVTDANFNASKLCAFIEVRKPDTIPPIKPILLNVSPELNGIKITWMKSDEEDVRSHSLYRKVNNDYEKVWQMNAKDSSAFYLDKKVESAKKYTYYLESEDEDGNRSTSEALSISYENGFREKITVFNAQVDRKKKELRLDWMYSETKTEKFIIYRKKENEKLSILKTLPGKERSFIDYTAQIGNIYNYRIKAVMADGIESIISDEVKVEY